MSSSSPFRSPSWRRLVAGVLALGALVSCEVGKLFQDGGSDPAPARLEFAAPPNGTAGEPLSPAVRVSAIDSSGSVDTAFHGTVTLTLGEHPEGAALRGTRQLDAVRGVASFADLSINRAGTGYTLVATATGVRGATSPTFAVAPATAARLAFTAQPHTATVDSVLKPPVQVTALDSLGNVATSFAADVTVALAANASGGTATAAFTISCTALTGNLTVSTTTTGANLDPDGYTFAVDGGTPQPIGINATIPLTGIPTGSRTVDLAGVAANCTVTGGASQTVTVPPGGSATAAFTITCAQLTGSVTVTTSTSGGTPDSNGYTVTVTGGGGKAIGRNDSVTFSGLATGSHTVTLSGIQSNCSVSGGASRPVTVATGQTASVPFTIDCPTVPPPTGDLTVTAATTGQDLDPDGYTVTVDGGRSRSLGINTSTTYPGLTATSHTVELTGIAGNCTVSGQNPRTVTVATSGTTTTFTITCAALPATTTAITVTAATT